MKDFLECIELAEIEQYRFLKTIGGGQASTLCVYKDNVGNKIAVKMLIAPRREEELQMFKKEAELHKEMSDSGEIHAPKILFDGLMQHNSMPIYYYIMEFIDGYTLEYYLKNVKPIPWPEELAVKMIMLITNALRCVSMRLGVHRDLHPGNIMLRSEFDIEKPYNELSDKVLIMDLGCHYSILSKYVLNDNKIRNYLHHIGAVSTWSPESLSNPESVTHKHDIWALGTIFFRILAGWDAYPIYGETFGEIYKKTVDDLSIRWELIQNKHFPVKLIIEKMLCGDVNRRLSLNQLESICIAIIRDDLLNKSQKVIKKFIDSNGDIVICGCCYQEVVPNGNMCPKCGHKDDEWLSVLI